MIQLLVFVMAVFFFLLIPIYDNDFWILILFLWCSSRFTDSNKYESHFGPCFHLKEERSGDICNACVLLVKRFRKLPSGLQRHWGHVRSLRYSLASDPILTVSLTTIRWWTRGPTPKSAPKPSSTRRKKLTWQWSTMLTTPPTMTTTSSSSNPFARNAIVTLAGTRTVAKPTRGWKIKCPLSWTPVSGTSTSFTCYYHSN